VKLRQAIHKLAGPSSEKQLIVLLMSLLIVSHYRPAVFTDRWNGARFT